VAAALGIACGLEGRGGRRNRRARHSCCGEGCRTTLGALRQDAACPRLRCD
jgi:hypothetical protein